MESSFKAEKIIKALGLEFRRERHAQGKTLEDVSFDLEVSPSYIGKIERSEAMKLSLYTYLTLAEYYNVNIEEMLCRTTEHEE